MLYITIILLLLVLIYYYDYQQYTTSKHEWYIFVSLIFILTAGLRYRLGIDTPAYEFEYTYAPDLSEVGSYNYEQSRYGVGFILFSALAKSISGNFVMLQLLHATFVTSVVFTFFYNNSRHPFFAVLLYFLISYFPLTFEVMRESCAVCMLLIGWKYFKENKWIQYYICAAIGILFHSSAGIMLILPIFYLPTYRFLFRMGKSFWITVGIVFAAAYILSEQFFSIIKLVQISNIVEYADKYENSKYAASTSLNIYGIITFIIRNLLYPVMAIAILKSKSAVNTRSMLGFDGINKLEYMFCWFVYIAVITLFIKIFYRFNNYFYPFAILAISDAVFTKFKRGRRIVKFSFGIWLILLSPFLALHIYGLFEEEGNSGIPVIRRYYPYESVMDPKMDKEREDLYHYYGR